MINIHTPSTVCHPLLDREWIPAYTMNDAFSCVYGLLLSPDKTSPLDSNNALAFYDDRLVISHIASTNLSTNHHRLVTTNQPLIHTYTLVTC